MIRNPRHRLMPRELMGGHHHGRLGYASTIEQLALQEHSLELDLGEGTPLLLNGERLGRLLCHWRRRSSKGSPSSALDGPVLPLQNDGRPAQLHKHTALIVLR